MLHRSVRLTPHFQLDWKEMCIFTMSNVLTKKCKRHSLEAIPGMEWFLQYTSINYNAYHPLSHSYFSPNLHQCCRWLAYHSRSYFVNIQEYHNYFHYGLHLACQVVQFTPYETIHLHTAAREILLIESGYIRSYDTFPIYTVWSYVWRTHLFLTWHSIY